MAVQCSISRAAARIPASGEPWAELPAAGAGLHYPGQDVVHAGVGEPSLETPRTDEADIMPGGPGAPSASPDDGCMPPRLSMEAIAMRIRWESRLLPEAAGTVFD